MATAPMAADAEATHRRFPDIELTTFDEFAARRAQAVASPLREMSGVTRGG
jgi:hypothetical protein